MPQDASSSSSSSSKALPPKRWFTTPAPIKRLFDNFPLHTYPRNPLPLSNYPTPHEKKHVLYIFTTPTAVAQNGASFNPSCLKWQTYLLFNSIPFTTTPSTNHASPTGSLPFLLPSPSSTTEATPPPIPANKLQRWARENNLSREEPSNMRYEAYLSLLDHRIRAAWLHTLYLTPANFSFVAYRLYIAPATSNTLVRLSLSYSLRAAAEAEILKHAAIIDAEALYTAANEAFAALSTLLGEEEWFFGAEGPGLFDASVFAYTHLLIDEGVGWRDWRMRRDLMRHGNLVGHRERIVKEWFGGDGVKM
ncbi:hypothetical protein MMC12_001170 [Toensbergia leucococca]|nr:hypothetical protein [Toensbergia leucococca]